MKKEYKKPLVEYTQFAYQNNLIASYDLEGDKVIDWDNTWFA